jgi:hypothetical protein
MMRLLAISLLCLTALAPHLVHAAESSAVADEALTAVTSVDQLPRAIQEELGRFKVGLGGIADRHEPYNSGDAIYTNNPRRRFVVAGMNSHRVLVFIEYGGIGYSRAVSLFERTGDEWKVVSQRRFSDLPEGDRLSLERFMKLHPGLSP